MASAVQSVAGVALLGAPDKYIGEKHVPSASRGTPVMQLEMTQDLMDELLKSIRSGRPPHILFGQNPILKYGDTKVVLDASKEKFRNELYKSTAAAVPGALDDVEFEGTVDYRLSIQMQKAQDAMTGADAALLNLKSNMEAIRKEKENSKYIPDIISHQKLALLTHKNRININSDGHLLDRDDRRRMKQGMKGRVVHGNVFGGRMVASNASSPAMSAASPKPGSAPTSAPLSSNALPAIQKALKMPLLHLLAVKPAKTQDLVRKTHAPKDDLVAVLGKIAKEVSSEWKLTDKAFKELDVWKFPYPSQEERQAAVDNAIRAYDRQRLDPEDKIWQKLLPEEERGKGKLLSKLSLGNGAAQKTTPTIAPTKLLKKTLAKKIEPKKRKSDESKEAAGPRKKAVKEVARAATKSAAVRQERPKPVEKKLQQSSEGVNGTTTKKAAKPATQKAEQKSDQKTAQKSVQLKTTQPKITERPFTSTKKIHGDASKNSGADLAGPRATQRASPASVSSAGKSTPSTTPGNSDRTLKRKANDLDNDIHKHDVGPKQRKTTAQSTPVDSITKNTSTPSSAERGVTKRKVLKPENATTTDAPKRKPQDSGTATSTPSTGEKSAPKRKVLQDSGVATKPPAKKLAVHSKAQDPDAATSKRKAPDSGAATSTPPTNKRKAQDSVAPTKPSPAKKLAVPSKAVEPTQTPTPNHSGASSISSTSSTHSQPVTAVHVHHDSPQSMHDSSSESPCPLEGGRVIELSEKFKKHYAKYEALHFSLMSRDFEREELAELIQMRTQLLIMKSEIKANQGAVVPSAPAMAAVAELESMERMR